MKDTTVVSSSESVYSQKTRKPLPGLELDKEDHRVLSVSLSLKLIPLCVGWLVPFVSSLALVTVEIVAGR